MDLSHVHPGVLIECLVMVFQFAGLAGLCLCRLLPGSRWSGRGRAVVLLAVVGLGVAGAISGRMDSAFGLFAGGTMTFLLIGMIAGSASGHPAGATRPAESVEAGLVG
jgi:hypothetical protein